MKCGLKCVKWSPSLSLIPTHTSVGHMPIHQTHYIQKQPGCKHREFRQPTFTVSFFLVQGHFPHRAAYVWGGNGLGRWMGGFGRGWRDVDIIGRPLPCGSTTRKMMETACETYYTNEPHVMGIHWGEAGWQRVFNNPTPHPWAHILDHEIENILSFFLATRDWLLILQYVIGMNENGEVKCRSILWWET